MISTERPIGKIFDESYKVKKQLNYISDVNDYNTHFIFRNIYDLTKIIYRCSCNENKRIKLEYRSKKKYRTIRCSI